MSSGACRALVAVVLTLVATIVFVFLAPSAAFWVCLGVPLVILGVIALMPQVGMTINFVSTVAFVIANALLEKFGGDSLDETLGRYRAEVG